MAVCNGLSANGVRRETIHGMRSAAGDMRRSRCARSCECEKIWTGIILKTQLAKAKRTICGEQGSACGVAKCGEAGAKSCECNKNRESRGGSAAMVGWAGTTGAACLLRAAEF